MDTKDKISATALVVSLFALACSVWSLLETKQQYHLTTTPVLEADVDFDRGTKRGGLYLVNKGLGPAMIDEFTMQGVSLRSDADILALLQLLKEKINPTTYPFCHKMIKVGTLKAQSQIQIGGRYALIEMCDLDFGNTDHETEWGKLQATVQDLRLKVRYHSLRGTVGDLSWP